MSKQGRLHIPVDVNFFTCPETARVGRDVAWTFLELLAYSKQNLSDGLVPLPTARRLGATPDALTAMTDVGWVSVGAEYVHVLAYGQWNDLKGRVREKRAAAAERQRRWREAMKAAMSESDNALGSKNLETETETETETESTNASRNASRNALLPSASPPPAQTHSPQPVHNGPVGRWLT